MVDPMSPAADWMDSSHTSFPADGKRVLLEFARRMIPAGCKNKDSTLLDEDVKALFIKALDATFYQPVVSWLLLHVHYPVRAAHDLLTIQQWVRECFSEHVRAGTATASAHRYSHGTHYMERGDGDSGGPGELADLRTMVLDLKRQLAAFVASADSEPSPRGFTPRADKPDRRVKTRFAASPLPKGGNWSQSISKKVAFHRDTGVTIPYCQNQHAIDHDDAQEFDALCKLAGGKPDIFADLSVTVLFLRGGRPRKSGPVRPIPFAHRPVTRTFADFIESTGIAVELPDEPSVHMAMLSAIEGPESVMDYKPEAYATSDEDDDDVSVEHPQPRYGCGRGIPGWGRSFLTSSLVCALFVIIFCATAAPHTASGVGGANAHAYAAPPVGGAAWTALGSPNYNDCTACTVL
ncbi:hypothetical protein CYMTET_38059 [Cymbomonas tetramitiformis]|uniref:Uncharacterized protein n=1 Tax=Cymbomonas tetramitiformis TaxID=36881 RepID=A0AAE0CEZ6_9CHLO|nr:hypothetical protein CYMTET_38059 [Cymbomonas tetramitiformis]